MKIIKRNRTEKWIYRIKKQPADLDMQVNELINE